MPAHVTRRKLVPAQKALIMFEAGEVNIDVEVHGGQRISKNSTDYHLFLMEWEKADDDMLFGRLKQIMAEYRADLGTDNFRAPLQAAIRDQAVKYQLLGYFEETAWTLENMQKFLNRNYSIKRQNRYRPDLLPTASHPYKYQDETFNTTEHFEAYGVGSFRKDPPYYHFGVYQYDPDATVIMKQNDFMRFMSLCYIQLRAIQYIQGDYSFSNVILSSSDNADGSARPPCKVADNDWIVFDSSELPLSPTAGHSASDFPAMALVVGWTGFLGESPAIYRSNRGACLPFSAQAMQGWDAIIDAPRFAYTDTISFRLGDAETSVLFPTRQSSVQGR